MSFIQFQCYACQQVLKVGGDKAGKKAKCIRCGTILTIPVESVLPAPPPPPPPSARATPPPPPLEEELPVARMEEDPVAELEELPAATARARFEDEPRSDRRRRDLEDYDERPRSKRRAEDDDDEQPRGRRREEDDYDDRPRGKRRDEDDYDDRPRSKRRDEDDDYDDRRGRIAKNPWVQVKLGFLLIFIGACVIGGATLLTTIGLILNTITRVQWLTGNFRGGGYGGHVLYQIGEPIGLCGTITAIVGYVFCMLGPNRRNSMGLAIALIAVAGVGTLMELIVKLPSLYGAGLIRYGFGYWFVELLIHLLNASQYILCPLLLQAFALARKDRDLASQSIGLLSLGSVFAGLGLIALIMQYASQSTVMGWITLILQWLTTLTFIGLLIWYTIAMWKARDLGDDR